jgi:2-desacetyl-2-hydroxyethyl bacteriochlorophyllide A dehydrogenase
MRMHAAFIDEVGPPENIRYGQLPTPQQGPTDVLVDVLYTTVNSVDALIRSGIYRVPMAFPFVIGRDLIGRVAAVGWSTPEFRVGDLVWCNSLGHGGRQGAAAEQAVVPVDRLYHLPEGVSPADAVTVLHPAATAYLALFTHGRLRAGETLLVAGGAGNVGSALVTMAVAAGARVIATAGQQDAEYCRALGAAQVLDYRDPNLQQQVRDHCPQGVNVYVDTSGHNDFTFAINVLAERGRIVLFAGSRSQPALPVIPLFQKSGSIHGFVVSDATIAELASAAREINRLLAAGQLRSRYTERRALSDSAQVHQRLERGELHRRRVVVEVAGH